MLWKSVLRALVQYKPMHQRQDKRSNAGLPRNLHNLKPCLAQNRVPKPAQPLKLLILTRGLARLWMCRFDTAIFQKVVKKALKMEKPNYYYNLVFAYSDQVKVNYVSCCKTCTISLESRNLRTCINKFSASGYCRDKYPNHCLRRLGKYLPLSPNNS